MTFMNESSNRKGQVESLSVLIDVCILLQVLQSFKCLHRTRQMVFQDDNFALQGMVLLRVAFLDLRVCCKISVRAIGT